MSKYEGLKKFKNRFRAFRVGLDVYIKDGDTKYYGRIKKIGKKKIHCTFGTDDIEKYPRKYLKIC